MAQPTAYNRVFSFTNFATDAPADPLPGTQVDAELNAVKQTLDETLTNLALLQRDDGRLANETVGRDQLTASIQLGFEAPTPWETGVSYAVSDTVFQGGRFYECETAHIAGVFATDLGAGKWTLLADFTTITATLGELEAASEVVASASTTDIGAATTFRVIVTGTATISALGTAANKVRFVRFTDAATITHSSPTLILPGAENLTTADGDHAIFVSDGSGNWRLVAFEPADGGRNHAIRYDVAQTLDSTKRLQATANIGAVNYRETQSLSDANKRKALDNLGFLPTGTTMLFVQSAAPAGWTKSTTHDDKALRIVSGTGGGSGGSSPFSTVFGKTATDGTTLTSATIPSHNHATTEVAHSHTVSAGDVFTGPSGAYAIGSGGPPSASANSTKTTSSVSTGLTINNAGSGGAHTHPMDIRVNYVDAIICVKD
jgi:hypothetical protein